jgi:Fe/S biogenesis protein NfuA
MSPEAPEPADAAEPEQPEHAGAAGSAAEPVITVTERARALVLETRAQESEPDRLALWLEVSGTAAGAYTYDMYFQAIDDAASDDLVQRHDDLSVVIPADSVDNVRGATLDLSGPGSTGMVINNPNRPPQAASPGMGRPPADLSGDVAQRIMQVLEQQINPSIAAHGGAAELVAVEDDVAYLRLSGGCQGCGLASVTLTQGIEVAIREAVPEVVRVADVTDHASGSNPYFESAKK